MTENSTVVYEPGDVVYGSDPYKGAGAARPWLVVSNHEGRPFHGEQYITLALTTRTWMDGLLEIEPHHWIRGGTPDDSRIVPWGVQSIGSDDVDFWQGRIDGSLVGEAVESLVEYVQR